MIDLLTQGGFAPFLGSAGLFLGLVLLEVIFLLIGVNTEIGADSGVDFGAAPDIEVGHVHDAVDVTHGTLAGDASGTTGSFASSLLDVLGVRGVPLTIWFALLAASFTALGFLVQSVLLSLTGHIVPGMPASAAILAPALYVTSWTAHRVGRILPRETTSAISEKSFDRRFGDVTVGVARTGYPAQVRFTDQHGNLQYLMAEPLDPRDEFREGARVLILRTTDGTFRLMEAE